jgi:hypothetical protein
VQPVALGFTVPASARPIEKTVLFEPPHGLAHRARQALRDEDDLLDHVAGQRRPRFERREIPHVLGGESAQGERVEPGGVAERGEGRHRVAVRDDDEQRGRGELSGDESQDLQRGGVGRIQIVEQDRERPLCPGHAQRRCDEVQHREAGHRRIRVNGEVLQGRARGRVRRLAPRRSREDAEDRVPWPQARRLAIARGGRHGDARGARFHRELLHQAALADTARAAQRDRACPSLARLVQRHAESAELDRSTDQSNREHPERVGCRRGLHRSPRGRESGPSASRTANTPSPMIPRTEDMRARVSKRRAQVVNDVNPNVLRRIVRRCQASL